MGRWVRCGGDAASPANGIGLEGGGNDGAGGGTTAAAEGEGRRLGVSISSGYSEFQVQTSCPTCLP